MAEQASIGQQLVGVRSTVSLVERAAWAWTDFVERTRLPPLVMAAGLLLFLYGTNLLIATTFGEARAFVEDYRRPASYLIVGGYAVYLVYLPRAIRNLWVSIRPWLANPDTEIDALEASTRPLVARYFLPSAAIWALFVVYWVATNSWSEGYDGSLVPRLITGWHGLFLTYFVGTGIAFGLGGVWSVMRLASSRLDFRPGLILEGGKAALRPFNHIFLGTWLFFLYVASLATVGTTPITAQGFRREDAALWVVIGAMVAVLASAQRMMSRMLEREKAEELRRLRAELSEARRLPDAPEPIDVLLSMHKTQMLQHDLQRVEAFSPTLVDTRFMVQISLSVTAILIANVVLRTVLEGLI